MEVLVLTPLPRLRILPWGSFPPHCQHIITVDSAAEHCLVLLRFSPIL